jgi:4-hydroxybenzoate polyprenyltransferase
MKNQTASDIPRGNWVDQWLPAPTRPYVRLARFDRPIGTWLVLFPCWWSLALSTINWANIEIILHLFLMFGLGAIIMRGAGCCLNDIADRNLDGGVARTKDRPLPAGLINVKQASSFMVFLGSLGLIVLLQFNYFAIIIGVISIPLVAIYPFSKRYTYWPQFVLGLTFNWGALLGWAAVRGDLQAPAILLYGAGICWTLGYDTIYAVQDKEDDAIMGIKSAALFLDKNTRASLYIFYGLTIFFMGICGWKAELSLFFYIGLSITSAQAIWQVWDVKLDNPHNCLVKFKSNRLFGWLVLGSIVAGQIF